MVKAKGGTKVCPGCEHFAKTTPEGFEGNLGNCPVCNRQVSAVVVNGSTVIAVT